MAMTLSAEHGGIPATAVTLYWRPGCPYCVRLRLGLRRVGLAVEEVNIWADPAAAQLVRRVAGGNETVPTVTIGDRSLVNPSTTEVLAAARKAGVAVPAGPRRPGAFAGLFRRLVRRQLS